MSIPFWLVAVIVPVCFSAIPAFVTVRYWSLIRGGMRSLSIYVIVSFLVSATTSVLLIQKITNINPSIHLFSIFEMGMLTLTLHPTFSPRVRKYLTGSLILTFTLIAVGNMWFLEPLATFPTNLLPVESIFMTGIAILYFVHALSRVDEAPIQQSPYFWVANAVLLYFGMNLFLYILSGFIAEDQFQIYWAYIHNSLMIIRDICFTIALWKSKKWYRAS